MKDYLSGETAVFHHISRFTNATAIPLDEIEINLPFLPESAKKIFSGGEETGLNCIGARPVMGKTTLMLQKVLSEPGRRAYIYSPEIHAKKLIERMLHILINALTKEEYSQFHCHPHSYLSSLDIYICECNIGIDELYDELKDVDGDIYIDYLQMLRPCGERHSEWWGYSEYIMEKLKSLAESHAVTAFSQINPIVEVRDTHCPTIEDFRFFEAEVPMFADKISVFYSDEYYTGELDDLYCSVFRFNTLKPAADDESASINLIRTGNAERMYINDKYWGERRPVFFQGCDGSETERGM